MSQTSASSRSPFVAFSLGGAVLAMACGMIAGACLSAVHWLFYRDADPFSQGWPLLLQIGACLSTFAIGIWSRHPWSAAVGLYGGLVLAMLASGQAEYPIASCIGLAVHGLVPALLSAGMLVYLSVSGWIPSGVSQARKVSG